MTKPKFTHTDYYSASLTRREDLQFLRQNSSSIIFSLYCAGVAIECMFRAYITKYTYEFDSKHDLEKLYEKSLMASALSDQEKEELSSAIKKVNKVWNNNLRYTSEKRMKRMIGHEVARTGYKDITKYLSNYYSDIFEATELILAKGQQRWT